MVPKGEAGVACAAHSQFQVPTMGSHRALQPNWWGLCVIFLGKGRNTAQAMRNKGKKVRNSSADTKVKEGGGGEGALSTRAGVTLYHGEDHDGS